MAIFCTALVLILVVSWGLIGDLNTKLLEQKNMEVQLLADCEKNLPRNINCVIEIKAVAPKSK